MLELVVGMCCIVICLFIGFYATMVTACMIDMCCDRWPDAGKMRIVLFCLACWSLVALGFLAAYGIGCLVREWAP